MIRSRTVALLLLSSTLTLVVCLGAKTILPKERSQGPIAGSASKEFASKDVWFEPKSAIDGLTAEGFRFSSEIWESTDGVAIFLYRQHSGSSKNASGALLQSVKDASIVFETKILTNNNGELKGKRSIVSFDKEPPQQRLIFWTEGEMLFRVESSSFQHALLFEKSFPSL